jgi:hypothetical protein
LLPDLLKKQGHHADYVFKIFPPELEAKPEFQEFMSGKYDKMIARFAEKDILAIMQSSKASRSAKDHKKMMDFFSIYEFLKYQEPAYYE